MGATEDGSCVKWVEDENHMPAPLPARCGHVNNSGQCDDGRFWIELLETFLKGVYIFIFSSFHLSSFRDMDMMDETPSSNYLKPE